MESNVDMMTWQFHLSIWDSGDTWDMWSWTMDMTWYQFDCKYDILWLLGQRRLVWEQVMLVAMDAEKICRPGTSIIIIVRCYLLASVTSPTSHQPNLSSQVVISTSSSSLGSREMKQLSLWAQDSTTIF